MKSRIMGAFTKFELYGASPVLYSRSILKKWCFSGYTKKNGVSLELGIKIELSITTVEI